MSNSADGAPAPGPSAPRRRRFHIEPAPLSESERIARRTRRIRILRAVALIGRSKICVATACRVVGLHDDWRAAEDVRGLLDVRQIPRRHRGGTLLRVPHTQEPAPEIVPQRTRSLAELVSELREVADPLGDDVPRADQDAQVHVVDKKAAAPKPKPIATCTVCSRTFEGRGKFCGGRCRIRNWRAQR
jgi:hypothetical protein